jgi:antitoxin component YwqK of YwqJK toxin-antitoxin module
MAQQVLFRNSLICIFAFLLACHFAEKNPELNKNMNSIDGNFRSKNGIVLLNNIPYTGYIFTLYPTHKDTALITGYLKGREHGIWKKFYPNGRLQEKRTYNNGQKVGVYNAFWGNGSKKLAYLFKNDEYDGLCLEWNREGKLVKMMHYKAGYEEGSQKLFYDDGTIKSNYVIENGRRYGLLGTKNCINVSDSLFKK